MDDRFKTESVIGMGQNMHTAQKGDAMILSNLIKKGGLAKIATVTPATIATQETEQVVTVATVATVAVASPSASAMTAEEETMIHAWLTHIEETDPDIIADVMNKCRFDLEARTYFLQRSKEVPAPVIREHQVTRGD